MKKSQLLIIAFLGAAILTFTSSVFAKNMDLGNSLDLNEKEAIITQKIDGEYKDEQEVSTIYIGNQVIGILRDDTKLDSLLSKVYKERYEKDFPDTKIGLGEDIHLRKTLSKIRYENKDEEILSYLDKEDMFSVEVDKIEFSNGEIAYVKNMKDFDDARDEYIQNYVKDKESYDLLKKSITTPAIETYGERYLSYKVKESATVSKGLAPESKILKNKSQISLYLSYGYEAKFEYYTTQEFDTVAGIAWLNKMSSDHLMAINTTKIKDIDQILPVGMEINVSQMNSPINVEVKKEVINPETVFPEPTKTVLDDTLREGMEVIDQTAENGSQDVKREIIYVNGEPVENKIVSSHVTKPPVQEVVRVGTKIEPKIGSGNFRYPVDNPIITCPWACYYGHQALDVQNNYNRYGKVLAADRGVVIENAYTSTGGYYMMIDHNNGFVTYYGHMIRPGFFQPGTTVAQGEEIGDIGMTGIATGPHVHFEIRVNGVRVDPLPYMP